MRNKTLLSIAGITILLIVYGSFDPAKYLFPQCPMRLLTGWLCPGCGSQRAIHQVLHGNFVESFRLNALFLPAVGYGMIGMLTAGILPEQWPQVRKRFYGLTAAYVALAVIIVFWVGRNLIPIFTQ